MSKHSITLGALMLLCPTTSTAQELPSFFHRLQPGDIGALGGPVLSPRLPVVNRSRDLYQTAGDQKTLRSFVAFGNRPLLVAGEPASGHSSATLVQTPSLMCVSPGGVLWSIPGYDDPAVSNGYLGLTRANRLVIRPGQVCTAAGVPPGSRYTAIDTIAGAFDQVCYFLAGLDQIGPTSVLLEVTTDPLGVITSERVIAMPGMTVPGISSPINRVLGGSIHENGASCLTLVVSGAGALVVINGTLTIRAGDPSPYPGRQWGSVIGGVIGSSGDWVVSGELDDGKEVMVKNDAPFFHEDELPPELDVATHGLQSMRPIAISSRGRVVWRARLDQISAPVTSGYFVERRPFLITEQTYVDGYPISGQITLCAGDEDGVNIGLGMGYLSPTGIVRIGAAFPLDQSDPACSNGPTSSGRDPIVSVHGSPWVSDGHDVEIMTRRLPPYAFALTMVSTQSAHVPGAGGAIGDLCLGGPILRSDATRSSRHGTTRVWLSDVNGITGQGPVPGDTWYFQTWYRDTDSASGGAVSRWSESVSLEFQ